MFIGGTSIGYANLNSDAKNILYPNGTAHPTTFDIHTSFHTDGKWLSNPDARLYVDFNVNGAGYSGITDSSSGTTVIITTKTSFTNLTKTYSDVVQASKDLFTSSNKSNVSIRIGTKATSTKSYIRYVGLFFYFTRYDFSAVSGEGVASASVSSATGYDGDEITFTAEVQDGYEFVGWYAGDTLVSTSQSYTHTINGSDLQLTAKAVRLYTNLYVKENGAYTRVLDVYKKVNGTYVKQTNIPALFPEGVKPLRMGVAIAMYGIALNGAADGIHADPLTCVTDYLPVPANCTNITVYPGGSGSEYHSVVHEYAADKSYLSYWANMGAERTFDFDYPAQIKYIRATFVIAQIDNCYIIDNTHGQYIYRGKNV